MHLEEFIECAEKIFGKDGFDFQVDLPRGKFRIHVRNGTQIFSIHLMHIAKMNEQDLRWFEQRLKSLRAKVKVFEG